MKSVLFIQLSLTAALVMFYIIGTGLLYRFIDRFALLRTFSGSRSASVKKSFNLISLLIAGIALALIWGIDLQGIYLFSSSFFALLGIAFFALWSILSNITCAIIIFFKFPHKIGDTISFQLDREYTGSIVDITMFYMLLEDETGNLITVPNNIFFQKIILIHK